MGFSDIISFITEYWWLITIVFIAGLFFVAIVIVTQRGGISAVFLDLLDLLLSWLDELFGVGLAGFQLADWVLGILAWKREINAMGTFPVLLNAWLIAGAVPISSIPGIGPVIGGVLNFVPTTSIIRLVFSKFPKAEKNMHLIDETLRYYKSIELQPPLKKSRIKELDKELSHGKAVKVAKESDDVLKELFADLDAFYTVRLKRVEEQFNYLVSQPFTEEQEAMIGQSLNAVHETIDHSKELQQRELVRAITLVLESERLLMSIAESAEEVEYRVAA